MQAFTVRVVMQDERVVVPSLAPEGWRLHLFVGEAKVGMQGVQVLQETLEVAAKGSQHIVVAGGLAEAKEELAKQLQDDWDLKAWQWINKHHN